MAITFSDFAARVTAKHPALTLVSFSGVQKPAVIHCKVHGNVTLRAENILKSSYGCPKCGKAVMLETLVTIPSLPKLTDQELAARLPAPYTFIKVAGTNPRRVYFTCPTHGTQNRVVGFESHGCAKCGTARRGFATSPRKAKETAEV